MKRLDWFVAGYGTGGTITGAGEMLKLARPDIKIAVTEPDGAALLSGKPWAPHKIQGWSPDFIPDVLNRDVYDLIVPVTDVQARDTARELAMKEGIFCGISGGGSFAAALEVAKTLEPGSVVLAMHRRHRRALPEHLPVRRHQRRLRRRLGRHACPDHRAVAAD